MRQRRGGDRFGNQSCPGPPGRTVGAVGHQMVPRADSRPDPPGAAASLTVDLSRSMPAVDTVEILYEQACPVGQGGTSGQHAAAATFHLPELLTSGGISEASATEELEAQLQDQSNAATYAGDLPRTILHFCLLDDSLMTVATGRTVNRSPYGQLRGNVRIQWKGSWYPLELNELVYATRGEGSCHLLCVLETACRAERQSISFARRRMMHPQLQGCIPGTLGDPARHVQ